jgi:hypothetical protein
MYKEVGFDLTRQHAEEVTEEILQIHDSRRR